MFGVIGVSIKPIFVVHVIHHLVVGGMENGVVNLINWLPNDRFKHAVVCIEDYSDFSRRIERDDVEVIALHRSAIGSVQLRWTLFKLFQRLRPDIVHTRNLSGLDALLPARLAGSKTLHSEHGFDVDNLQGSSARPLLLRRLHAPLVRQFVCVSQNLYNLMTQQWGIAPARVHQIYNGVDIDRFTPGKYRPNELLPEGFLGIDKFVVGTVGRVRPIKDQATLIRAVARLLVNRPGLRPRVRMVLVGEGPLLEELKILANSLDISEICWFSGVRNDIATVLKLLDLFVLPSLNEGISNTLLEAMASGLPVLATAVGGNLELLVEGETGASFAPGDAEGLAALIMRYATDSDLCARHGHAAHVRAIERFSLHAMVENYQTVYEQL